MPLIPKDQHRSYRKTSTPKAHTAFILLAQIMNAEVAASGSSRKRKQLLGTVINNPGRSFRKY